MNTAAEQAQFFKELARSIDEILIEEFEKRIDFALLLFEFESTESDKAHVDKAANYVSNGRRKDMIKFLRESAERLENNENLGIPIGEA